MLAFIEKAGSDDPQTTLPEKEKSRQFIGKLIEYIGNCGRQSSRTGAVKYLLMSFIGVLDMAGEDQETAKGKHKAKKRILVLPQCDNREL
ncbi:MAG: hypothetical protein P4M11_02680 [Candidatus Pacebacteria bacterium]|nr:hypothetical protein [Candidatus Paceibacterota bacterium]